MFEATGFSCHSLDEAGFLFITVEDMSSREQAYACLEVKEVFLLRNWLTKQLQERIDG